MSNWRATQLEPLVGYKIVSVIVSEDNFGLLLRAPRGGKEVQLWILRDDEWNGAGSISIIPHDKRSVVSEKDDGDGGHLTGEACPNCGAHTMFQPDSGDPLECSACGFQVTDE